MRLNIRLCITVALFAVVQPATASEFNQVIEDFDRYIQTEKDSGNFPASVRQPNRYPAQRVDQSPAVKSAGKTTGSTRKGTQKVSRAERKPVLTASERATRTVSTQKAETTTPAISVPAQCETIVVKEPVVVTNPIPVGYPQWSPAYLVRDSQKWSGKHKGFVFSPIPGRQSSSLILTPGIMFSMLGEPFRSMTYFSELPLTVARVLEPENWFKPTDTQKQLRLTRVKLQDVSRELAALNEKYQQVKRDYDDSLIEIAKNEMALKSLTLANNELKAAAENSNSQLAAELDKNKKTIDSLNQQISENLSRYSQSESQIAALTGEKTALEKQISSLSKEKELSDKNIALLENKNADVAKISQQLIALEQQLAARDAEKSALTEQLSQKDADNRRQAELLKADLQALASEKNALNKQIATLKADNLLSEKNLALLQDKNADMAKVSQKLTGLEKQLAVRDAEKENLTTQLRQQAADNSKQSEQLKKELLALTADKTLLVKQIAQLNTDKALAEKNMALLQDKNADMATVTQKLTSLEKQLQQQEADKQQLTEKVLALTTDKTKESDALKRDLLALTADKAGLEKQITRLKSDSAAAEKNITLLQDKNADLANVS